MTIRSSGAWCDVCGKPILPFPKEMVHSFGIQGIKNTLHADNKCRDLLTKAQTKNDWKLLPKGPIRKLFEKEFQKCEDNDDEI